MSDRHLQTPDRPKRIQRQRTKGWRMPPNTVYVGRPTRWDNPFSVHRFGLERALEYYRAFLQGEVVNECFDEGLRAEIKFHGKGTPITLYPVELARIFLRGKNLACWCPLNQPCHADVLLELANAD